MLIDLIRRLANQSGAYPYRIWGYGESIGVDGLLAATEATGDQSYFEFAHGLVDAWVAARPEIHYTDHVAPGVALLEVYQRTQD